jgi:hypothetical protein
MKMRDKLEMAHAKQQPVRSSRRFCNRIRRSSTSLGGNHTAPVAVSELRGNSEPMAGYLTPRNPTNEVCAGHRWPPYGEVENGKQP